MSSLPLLRRRRERRLNERRASERRISRSFLTGSSLLVISLAVTIIGGAFSYASLTANLPSTDLMPTLLDAPNGSMLQPTRIYDRSGQHLLAVLAQEDTPRTYISLDSNTPEHLPDGLVRATLALTEPGFYGNPGYTLRGLENPELHPTLAQTITANLLLWQEAPTLQRALRERILAAQITTRFGHDKILEWYLNTANYGHYAYGAQAAAQLYFNKAASQLNLAEAAMLAAVSQAPAINPLDASQAARQRQRETLDQMLALKFISAEQHQAALLTPVITQPDKPSAQVAPAFVALALDQLDSRVDRARIESGGMRVITTLDYNLQVRTSCAVQTQLTRLTGQNALPCTGAEALPALPPGLDVRDAVGSAVVLDPHSGQILAAVGDSRIGEEAPFFTAHRPGTLLTPFLYLAGFTRSLGPASLVWDVPAAASTSPSAGSTLQNPDGKFHGPIRLRQALVHDYLAPAEQVFTRMGAPLVAQTMRPFGLEVPTSSAQDLLDGEMRFSVFDLAQAYGVFASQGTLVNSGMGPSAVLRVEGTDYRAYLDFSQPKAEQVVSQQLAYLVTDMLSRPVPLEIGIPAALKTGQTLDGSEIWAAGYTPYRVAVVWIADGRSGSAAGLWAAIMQAASRDQSPDGWKLPSGVLRLKVCDPSGMLPSPACPNLADEVFLEGFEPNQPDSLYQTYSVNRETSLLATVFTAPQLLEQRIYMHVPPEAQQWADEAHLPKPPEAYDTIQQPPSDPNAHITIPTMFGELNGNVTITGTAAGDDLAYYRLQYGQGLNPPNWSQIGTDSTTPVLEGTLAEWDTSGLNGLYALQLLVVHTDNSITTATVMVTIKN